MSEQKKNRPGYVYVVTEGQRFDSSFRLLFCTRTKAEAEKICRLDGFRWSKEDGLFLNAKSSPRKWRDLIRVDMRSLPEQTEIPIVNPYSITKKQYYRPSIFISEYPDGF